MGLCDGELNTKKHYGDAAGKKDNSEYDAEHDDNHSQLCEHRWHNPCYFIYIQFLERREIKGNDELMAGGGYQTEIVMK